MNPRLIETISFPSDKSKEEPPDEWIEYQVNQRRTYKHHKGDTWVQYCPSDRPRWYWCKAPQTLTELLMLTWQTFPASCRTLEQRKAYALMMVRMGETG